MLAAPCRLDGGRLMQKVARMQALLQMQSCGA